MIRVFFEDMQNIFADILTKYGLPTHKANRCAKVFSQSSLDGVYSHGVNRFPLFVQHLQEGYVNVDADPECLLQMGTFERYEGHLGPGIWNASFCMDRAIAMAQQLGMSCVSLRHTNHWMRGGAYGWQAVDAGCAAICFTNTKPNMPAWGAKSATVGNNPLIIAVPHKDGPVVLDMSMSLFSYGKMENYQLNGEPLPFPGGFDNQGILSTDPRTIINNERTLPVGYWKGSGLSIMLDLMASILSGGKTTHQIGQEPIEYALSQVFICFDMNKLGHMGEELIENVKESLKTAELAENSRGIFYPGQRTLATRKENAQKGIPVNPSVWEKIMEL
ncbi:MAG: 3-dehydro-L-gulonate 2-dehydrogenase [Bacteroidota bacterium]